LIGNKKYQAIVIGTSAGGLIALSSLLENLPVNYPIPIIIVQHRSKEPRDLLEEILQGKCNMKVKQADEKEKIESGFIYIAPPDYHLLIEKDFTFSLTADEAVLYSRPSIDVLFESAASVYKDKLIGIILTGANSDGANGLRRIAENNGLTIVQTPDDAQFSVMPLAAIATQKVNFILSLLKIQSFLLNISDKNEKE
jgi:two-component system chemotaxis response regulator CheB